MATQLIMPEMGEGVIEGTVARWLKAEGETVEQYEAVLEIETDKVTTEATAEEGGTLLKIMVPEGETVPVGAVLAIIGQPGEAIPADGKRNGAAAVAADLSSKTGPEATVSHSLYTGRISPVVGRIAAEHEIDLNLVNGTGRDGRITKNDILAYIEGSAVSSERLAVDAQPPAPVSPAPPPLRTPAPQPAPPPLAGELMPLTSMRRAIAEHMVRSKHTSPHVTTVFEF